jgi:hypothetical protein
MRDARTEAEERKRGTHDGSEDRRLILRVDQSGLTSDSLGEAERGRWPTRGYDGHMAGTSMAARPPSVVLAYRCSGQKGNLPVEG